MIRRKKRKHCARVGQPLRVWTAANQEWALDFLHDAVECGRAIRVLSVVDAYTRECLALEVDTSFASRRVTRVLDVIIAERGRPLAIRCDNGPEFTSRHFLAWAVERGIEYNEARPHSSLGYLTPHEYAAEKSKASCGKDAGQKAASLENAKSRVSHFPTAPAATGILETIQGPNVV